MREWRKLKLATTGATVIVAVSGGADSVSLLLALDELVKSGKLNLTLCVAHLNHKLRPESHADARWVARLARQLGHKSSVGSVEVKTLAKKTGDNLEQAARRARYEFLAKTANRNRAEIVLAAHTMDDQAETVLLNLLRGSGLDGLGGIEPVRTLVEESGALLARPLLSWARRGDTATYCQSRRVEFRADEMNKDKRFARVRVRLPVFANGFACFSAVTTAPAGATTMAPALSWRFAKDRTCAHPVGRDSTVRRPGWTNCRVTGRREGCSPPRAAALYCLRRSFAVRSEPEANCPRTKLKCRETSHPKRPQ